MSIQPQDFDDLVIAKQLLENPGVAVKFAQFLGTPIENGLERLPDSWNNKVGEITAQAISKAAHAATSSMDDAPGAQSMNMMHKIAVATTGGVGGLFGLPALAIELPISTTIMLRSIADIARSEGEIISEVNTRLACLEVFSLGGPNPKDDAGDSAYFAARLALAHSVSEAAEQLMKKTVVDASAPALVRLIAIIAKRFSLQVSEKVAAQAVPAIGVAGGAIINTLFIDHFQTMARGHFIMRRLERKYGRELIADTYHGLPVQL